MKIDERLDYIAARMHALYPEYGCAVARIRGTDFDEIPHITVSVDGLNEDASGRESQSYMVEVLLKRGVKASEPDAADRDLMMDQLAHASAIKDMLRTSSFRDGKGVTGFSHGAFGAVRDIDVEFEPRANGAVLISSVSVTFDVIVANTYSDPVDDDLTDLESIGGPVTFDDTDPLETELYK